MVQRIHSAEPVEKHDKRRRTLERFSFRNSEPKTAALTEDESGGLCTSWTRPVYRRVLAWSIRISANRGPLERNEIRKKICWNVWKGTCKRLLRHSDKVISLALQDLLARLLV